MQALFIDYIYLLLIILVLVMIGNKLRIAYPIMIVIGGLALSFTKKFSDITIDPQLFFFIFLPPLLYEAAWQTSWKEFWKWRRVITSFAFPIVIITSSVIAWVSTWIIPGFTIGLGFLLGGIISPPDAVSSTAIMRQVHAPKSLVSIIEGESLLNDASSLIVFRFALLALITGQFSIGQATVSFLLVISMGVLIGLAVGLIFYAAHRWLPTTPGIETVLSLVAPYCMYLPAEHYHFSGVLAVVSGGLFLSNKRQLMLNYRSRIQGVNVWNSVVFVLNGLVFMLIGLQLPAIIQQFEKTSLITAISYGLAIWAALILTRLLCTFGAAIFTKVMSRFITVADDNPGWKMPFILGWAGMRGVVSLAAALSIPILIKQGVYFPYRNVILFITFVVILISLLLQGLTLPWLIRKINLQDSKDKIPEDRQELIIQKKLAQLSAKFLEEGPGKDLLSNKHIKNLAIKLRTDTTAYDQELSEENIRQEVDLREFRHLYIKLLDHQRKLLRSMNRKSEFDEDLIRKHLSLVDLEEYKVRERIAPDE